MIAGMAVCTVIIAVASATVAKNRTGRDSMSNSTTAAGLLQWKSRGGGRGRITDSVAAGCEVIGSDKAISNARLCIDQIVRYSSILQGVDLPACPQEFNVSESELELAAVCYDVHYSLNKENGKMFIYNRTQVREDFLESTRQQLYTTSFDFGYLKLVNSGSKPIGVSWMEDALDSYNSNVVPSDCINAACAYESTPAVARDQYAIEVDSGEIGYYHYKRFFCSVNTDIKVQIRMITYSYEAGTRHVQFTHYTEVPTTAIALASSTNCVAPDESISGCTPSNFPFSVNIEVCFETTSNPCHQETEGSCGVLSESGHWEVTCQLQAPSSTGDAVYMNSEVQLNSSQYKESPLSYCQ